MDTGANAIAWIGAGLLLALVELIVLDFTFLLLGAAAVGAAAATGLGAPLPVQLATFGALAIALLVAVRPFARRHAAGTEETRTNVDALVGAHAKVLQPVTEDGGLILLTGEHWTARTERSDADAVIPAGADVTVTRIVGATAIVRPESDPDPC